MPKSIKPKNNTYMDSTGIVHNRELLSDLLSRISLMAYPVGSIYISVNNTNPSTLFGGTWEQLQDRFLLACSSIYTAGSRGGEATHTLTVNEIPSHTHDMDDAIYGNYKNRLGIRGDGGGSNGLIPSMTQTTGYSRYKPTNTGGGQAHNNMPPYLAVYMWKRTA